MNEDSNSLEELRDIGKKKRALKEQKKAIAKKEQKKQAASNRQIMDQERVFLHITRWHGFGIIFKVLAFIIFTSCVFGIPVYVYILSTNRHNEELVSPILVNSTLIIITFIATYIIVRNMRNNAVLNEVKWIKNLPFSLIAFPDFLVYRSYPSFRITINFIKEEPTKELVLDLLSSLPFDVKYNGDKEHPFRYEVTNPKGSKFNQHRRWAYRWIHQACDNQLHALHKSNPIANITIGEGTKELNFDWWVPLKKNKWWHHWI